MTCTFFFFFFALWRLQHALLSPTWENNETLWSTSAFAWARHGEAPSAMRRINESSGAVPMDNLAGETVSLTRTNSFIKLGERVALFDSSNNELVQGHSRGEELKQYHGVDGLGAIKSSEAVLCQDTWNFETLLAPLRFGIRFHIIPLPRVERPTKLNLVSAPNTCIALVKCVKDPPPPGLPADGIPGVGRQSTFVFWIPFVCLPIVSVLLLVMGSSTPKIGSTLEVKPIHTFVALCGAMGCAFQLGIYCTKFAKRTWPMLLTGVVCIGKICEDSKRYTHEVMTVSELLIQVPVVYTLLIILLIATFRFARIEFKFPCIHGSPYLHTLGVLRSLFYCVCTQYAIALPTCGPEYQICTRLFREVLFNVVRFSQDAWLPPNIGALLPLYTGSKAYIYCLYCWGDSTGVCLLPSFSFDAPTNCTRLVIRILICLAPYSRDRWFVVTVGFFTTAAIRCGQMFLAYSKYGGYARYDLSARIAIFLVIAVVGILAVRYERVLPAPLRKAKFVRLSYLYKMQREGRVISRCQEVPDSAFGNPSKAAHLVVISHRWLDRYKCDVATSSCPGGLRLTSLCQRFEKRFPRDWPSFAKISGSPFSEISRGMESTRCVSHDILVFFDFMGLPQVGMSSDGTIIERSAEEELLFREVIPHMGALYTMYDVLVSPEVSDGVMPYISSGWCYCEYQQAMIHDNLEEYSGDVRALLENSPDGGCSSPSGSEGLEAFERNLRLKVFHFEHDRETVRKIIQGTHLVHNLYKAVQEQNEGKVQVILEKMSNHKITEVINHAVDEDSLDTLLHVAVRLPSKQIVDLLVSAGADWYQPNNRGDAPGELFMIQISWLPRLSTYR